VNGLLIGGAIGVAAGFVSATASCPNDPECAAITTLVFVPIFAGGGLAVGALMDSATHKYDPVYVQSASNPLGLRVSPIVARDRKGVRLAFSF